MSYLYFDTETYPFAKGCRAPRLVCVSACFDDGPPGVYDRASGLEIVANALYDRSCHLVAHNTTFDLAVVANARPDLLSLIFDAYRSGRIRCTQVREQLYRNAIGRLEKSGFGLSDCARRWLGYALEKGDDTWRGRYNELDGVPVAEWPREAYEYSARDAHTVRDVFKAQTKGARAAMLLDADDFIFDEGNQTRAQWFLGLTSTWGITTDPVAVAALKQYTVEERDKLLDELVAVGLVADERPSKERRKADLALAKAQGVAPPKLRKPGQKCMDQVRERVIQAYKGRPPLTDTGLPATDKLVCSESGDEVLIHFSQFTNLGAMLSKNIPLLEEGTIHTNFSMMAANGRSRSAHDDDFDSGGNIQNINKKGNVRPCFVPRSGGVWRVETSDGSLMLELPQRTMITADYGSLELCTLAQFCLDTFKFSILAEEINSGLSPLIAFGASMAGCSYDEGKALHKAEDARFKDFRQSAKVALYGFPGGLSPKSLPGFALSKYNVRITEQKAQQLKQHWLSHYREMPSYLAHASRVSEQKRIVQPRSGRVRGAPGYTDTCNTFFSGLGSDVAKSAGFEVVEECYAKPSSVLYGWRPVNFVHDSIQLEGPPSTAEAAVDRLSTVMIESAKYWLPDVTIGTSKSIGLRWEEKD